MLAFLQMFMVDCRAILTGQCYRVTVQRKLMPFGYELCMSLGLYHRYNLLYTRSLNQKICVFKQDYKYADMHKNFF